MTSTSVLLPSWDVNSKKKIPSEHISSVASITWRLCRTNFFFIQFVINNCKGKQSEEWSVTGYCQIIRRLHVDFSKIRSHRELQVVEVINYLYTYVKTHSFITRRLVKLKYWFYWLNLTSYWQDRAPLPPWILAEWATPERNRILHDDDGTIIYSSFFLI